ncbi:hypothetical protein NEOKW01_2149, partial [Nematocida sp. AWRm80]
FSVPSRYFSAIGLPRSLAFGGSLHRSPCAPVHGYSPALARTGLPPSLARIHAGSARRCTPPPVRRGLLPFRSPLLRESVFVSSPPRTDMLKSRGWPRASRAFGNRRARACAPFRVRRALPRPDSRGVPRRLSRAPARAPCTLALRTGSFRRFSYGNLVTTFIQSRAGGSRARALAAPPHLR